MEQNRTGAAGGGRFALIQRPLALLSTLVQEWVAIRRSQSPKAVFRFARRWGSTLASLPRRSAAVRLSCATPTEPAASKQTTWSWLLGSWPVSSTSLDPGCDILRNLCTQKESAQPSLPSSAKIMCFQWHIIPLLFNPMNLCLCTLYWS